MTEDGRLHSWGGGKYKELMLNNFIWSPPSTSLRRGAEELKSVVVDVAVGLNHSIALDSHGCIWSWGSSNKFQQLGRSGNTTLDKSPALVTGLPEDVVWQKVS